MAENLENAQFNFSIENTFEMGAGNAELLNDLMSPETASSSPDDIQDIKSEPPVKQEAPKTEEKPSSENKEKEDASASLQKFLLSNTEDDEEEEEEVITPAPKAKVKTEPAQKQSEKEEEKESEEDSEETPEATQFGALANDLFKLGVFTKAEDEEDGSIATPEQFLERFQEEKQKGAVEMVNNFIGQFGEDYQQAFQAIFVKGVDPKEYFGTYNNIVSFAEMDLSDENNQVRVLKQALTDQGFEPEDVDTEIDRLKNYGDLETVATKHHKVLVKKEAAKLQQVEQKAQQELQQKQAIKNQYVSNVQSILEDKLKAREFDGIPLNPKLVNELQDFLLVDRYKTNSGETITEFDKSILELKRPENHEKKVKVGLLLKILEKDPTLSTIQKTGVSKKSTQLFSEVARQASKTSVKSGGGGAQKANSWFL
jgi:hypothetical protein